MQFSVFDLTFDRLELETEDDSGTADTEIIPIGNDTDNLALMLEDDVTFAELFYGLDAGAFDALDFLGPGRELVFRLGDQEFIAYVGADGSICFVNLDAIDLLETEDYLTLQLYQNGDDANVLWEYAFADLFIQTTDPEFPGIQLRWDDYYPALGDKRINIKTRCNLNGQNIRAEILNTGVNAGVKSAVDGTRAAVATTQFNDDHTATFYLSGLTWVPESDPNHVNNSVRIKFTLFNKDGSKANDIEGTWRVKNNSNTNLAEVLAGEAVFVCDLQRNADGSFNTTGGVYHANVGDSHKGDSTGDSINLREVDFVQELLNQVVSRKRNVTYTLMAEDGYFGTGTGAGIHTFKEAFHVANTAEGSPFRKLMKDYSQESSIAFWEDKFVDKQLLVGGTQRTDLANSPDNLINTVAGNTVNDTGLYELYENVVKVFITSLINVADSYRNNSSPTNTVSQWVSRTGEVVQTSGTVTQAVSYSFGGRQTVIAFNSSVSKHGAPSYSDIENNSNYAEYQGYSGNIGETPSTEPSTIRQTHGIVGGGDQKWPGLYSGSEYSAGISGVARYYHENWAGVDCIGFTIQTLRYAEQPATYSTSQALAGTNDSAISGVNIAETCVSSSATCADKDSIHTYVGLMNTNVSRFFNTANSDLMHYWLRTTTSEQRIHKGDFVHYDGHISIVYSNSWGESNYAGDYDIIHAYGTHLADIDNSPTTPMEFSRKVVLTPNRMSTSSGNFVTPIGFGRIKLWN